MCFDSGIIFFTNIKLRISMEAKVVLNEKVRKVLLIVMLVAIVISLILTGVAPILSM